MNRKVFAELYVDEEVSGVNEGTLDYVEKEMGWVNESGIYLRGAILVDRDSDSQWERYINYLCNWALSHNDEACDGMSPASFEEWRNNEDAEED